MLLPPDAFNFGLSDGGRLTFRDVLVAVELSFKLSIATDVFNESWLSGVSSVWF